MAGRKVIMEALNEIEKTRDQLFVLFRKKPEGWKEQYLQQRVVHQTQVAHMLRLCDEWLAAQDGSAQAGQFRALLSRMRGALAEHQGRWPVIAIVPDDPAYVASMAGIDAARGDVVTFVRVQMTD